MSNKTVSRQETCIRCGRCCAPTEMHLSREDVARIARLGEDIDTCTVLDGETGLRMLKNVDGHCIFLESHPDGKFSCKIYPERPRGCRFYPLVFNPRLRQCRIDYEYCPHGDLFQDKLSECKSLLEFLASLRLL